MSLTRAERERKAGNARRRAAEQVLRSLPKPDSRATARRRFEELHDAWRKAAGLPAVVRMELANGNRICVEPVPLHMDPAMCRRAAELFRGEAAGE